jgi:hypothetical protein
MFGKTNVSGQIFKLISHRCRLSFHVESLLAGYGQVQVDSWDIFSSSSLVVFGGVARL